jgi:hypothetical protein
MSLQERAMFFTSVIPAMMLAFEAGNVIDLRLWKIAGGGAEGAAESSLMISEKIDALFEAGTLLTAGGTSVQVIAMYRRHVAANAVRLRTLTT